jgi:hypothetical protein
MFHVKQFAPDCSALERLFHVKQRAEETNKEILFTNTKISKDHIQDIFNVDPAQ